MADAKPITADAAWFQTQALNDQRDLAGARSAGRRIASDNDLEEASEQFESLLLNIMIREMRATVSESTLFPQSMAQDVFTSMLDDRVAGEISRQGGIGISRMIFDQLKGGK